MECLLKRVQSSLSETSPKEPQERAKEPNGACESRLGQHCFIE